MKRCLATCAPVPVFFLVVALIITAQVVAAESPPTATSVGVLLMTPSKWDDLTKEQQGLYVKEFLETVSFLMYGDFPRNEESAKVFSDWTACAERENPNTWMPLGWLSKGEVGRTAASQFYEIIPSVCRKMDGKGDKTWKPARLISKAQWSSLSLRDKGIYVTAYLETVDDILRRTKQVTKVRRLEDCVRNEGVEKILNAVESTAIEWQAPMPWSISRAVGRACPRI